MPRRGRWCGLHGGQRRGKHHHQDRIATLRARDGHEGLADVELPDDAGEDVVDDAVLYRCVVDVDVEEHEAGPCCCELRLDRDLPVLQRGEFPALGSHAAVLLFGGDGEFHHDGWRSAARRRYTYVVSMSLHIHRKPCQVEALWRRHPNQLDAADPPEQGARGGAAVALADEAGLEALSTQARPATRGRGDVPGTTTWRTRTTWTG